MFETLMELHSGLRWVMVVAVLILLVRLGQGVLARGSQTYGRLERLGTLVFQWLFRIQWLLGIILLLFSGDLFNSAFGYRWEHAITMTLALAVFELQRARFPGVGDGQRYRRTLFALLAASLFGLRWRSTCPRRMEYHLMRLYFLRHAQAEVRGRVDDFSRELTPRGKARTKTAAKVIQKLDLGLDAVYSSPRIRAMQTADIVAEKLEMPVIQNSSMGEFHWGLPDLEGLLSAHNLQDSILLVGHEPTFSDTIGSLTGGIVVMKKGGLARIDVYAQAPTRGMLVWMIAPMVFDKLQEGG